MNLYFLEYNYPGRLTGVTKRRSYFYRPEHVEDRELWNLVKTGQEVKTLDDVETGDELDQLRKMKKKSDAMSKYR